MEDHPIAQAVLDAETSLNTLLAYLAPLAALRDNLRSMADAVLADAKAAAGALEADARSRVDAAAAALAGAQKDHAAWMSDAAAQRETLSHEIELMTAKRDAASAAADAEQARLGDITQKISATLAQFK